MAVTLALLALNQEEQERVYRHIMNTVGLRDLVSRARVVGSSMVSDPIPRTTKITTSWCPSCTVSMKRCGYTVCPNLCSSGRDCSNGGSHSVSSDLASREQRRLLPGSTELDTWKRHAVLTSRHRDHGGLHRRWPQPTHIRGPCQILPAEMVHVGPLRGRSALIQRRATWMPGEEVQYGRVGVLLDSLVAGLEV